MAVRLALNDREIDASLAGVCGAYCGACPVYRAWADQDGPRLEALARSLGTTADRLLCTGCRTPSAFCFGGECGIKQCAHARGVVFCTECGDYPCDKIRAFRGAAPYRSAMCRDAEGLREVGVTAWLREEDARWRCPGCGVRVPAGVDACPSCGSTLANL